MFGHVPDVDKIRGIDFEQNFYFNTLFFIHADIYQLAEIAFRIIRPIQQAG
jgi:hypothetical protein